MGLPMSVAVPVGCMQIDLARLKDALAPLDVTRNRTLLGSAPAENAGVLSLASAIDSIASGSTMFDAVRSMASTLPGAALASAAQHSLRGAAAAASQNDLPGHLLDLANRDELVGFLRQTDDAVELARSNPIFGEQLQPLLGEIRDALATLPQERLSSEERDAVAATTGQLDDYLGVPLDPTEQVPGGGLEAHENAGSHLIERHVGKSEADLIERLGREKISASSSFVDLPSAERFVAQTIALNQDKVDAWLDGKGGNRLVLQERFDASTGISVSRGDMQAEDVHSVKLVLERSDALGIGYRIVTGYPSAP